jgi:N-acetyl-anhydromuramyl-L-alanine amidase AmpD
MTKIERIQQVLKDAGVYPFKVDNDFGRKSRTALNQADRATIKLVQAVLGFVGNDVDGRWGVLSEGRLQAAIAGKEAPTEAPHGNTPAPVLTPGGLNMGSDHWLVGVWRQPLPGGGPLKPRYLVEHFTGGADGDGDLNGDFIKDVDGTVDVMKARGVSAHFTVDRDGTIVQHVPCNQKASHAGRSQWVDPTTGILYSSSNGKGGNDEAIGIEIANLGDSKGAFGWGRKNVPGFATLLSTHWSGKQNGGDEWEIFYPAQIASVLALSKLLVVHYGLRDVTGHDRITQRKNDPGPAFQQHLLAIRATCGFAGMPAVHRSPL